MTLDPSNPFAARSVLPFELPDFPAISVEHYRPAIEAGMAAQLLALRAVAQNPAPPDVSNVIEAWEASGQLLGRATTVLFSLKWADTNEGIDAVEEAVAPLLAQHWDAIYLDSDLYQRILALVERAAAGEVDLDPEQAHWLTEARRVFERSGVGLGEAEQDRLRAINTRAAELESAFSRASMAGSNAAAVWVSDSAELAGLSTAEVASARERAVERGRPDAWLIELDNTTGQRVLDVLEHRGLRERIHTAATGRGLGGEHDTRPLVVELARLRAERAGLLGFPSHADYAASDGCAGSAEAVWDRLTGLVPALARNIRTEAAQIAQVQQRLDPGATLEAWDWQFYSELVRSELYALDASALRPYLELENVLHKGVFAAATGLYGITFHPRADLIGYHREVRTWEVREPDGTPIGLFLGDFYTRASKAGGAWMNNLVDQNHQFAQLPVVVNNSNLVKPPAGEPTLMTWDDVITLFHEFGHTLHGLLSDVRYASKSGTNTPRDFVEFPSQVNEMWALDPALLASYAVHVDTGEPMPAAWLETLVSATKFQQGFKTGEYLGAALLDQVWHATPLAELPESADEVEAFEAAALAKVGLAIPLVPPRYRTTYFRHTFEGGYDAGYYAYLWSEVMDADTAAWMRSQGGLTRENGERFRRLLLARGGSVDALDTYRDYRGQDAELTHLLERRGLL